MVLNFRSFSIECQFQNEVEELLSGRFVKKFRKNDTDCFIVEIEEGSLVFPV